MTDMARLVPGMKYDRGLDAWTAPAGLMTALACRLVFQDTLQVSDEGYTLVSRITEDNAQRLDVLSGVREPPNSVPSWLFPFQRGSAYLMSDDGWFCNTDDRGNGKTPQALAAIEMAGGPALVVCTKSMLWTWASECEKFTPSRTPYVLSGNITARRKALDAARQDPSAVVICTWTVLTKHSLHAHYGSVKRKDEHAIPRELNGGWIETVVADEVHKAVNPYAQQTRALWAVGDGARTRIGLTATPVVNDAIDLWGILRFLDPATWPSRGKFRDMFVLERQNNWGGSEVLGLDPATRPVFDKYWAPRSCRRPLQSDVKTLPPQVRWLDMTPKQSKAYNDLKKKSVAALKDGGILTATDTLTLNMRLQQIAAATPVVDEAGDVVALDKPSCKVDALHELLDEMNGDPLVVFAESRKLIELVYSTLCNDNGLHPKAPFKQEQVGIVTGRISDIERTYHVNRFQAGELPVILLTIGAGSEGLTLTRAATAVFLQRSWRMTGNIQAEGRVLRLGQERNVQFIDFITRGTVEERVHLAHDRKEGNLQDLLRDPDWAAKGLV